MHRIVSRSLILFLILCSPVLYGQLYRGSALHSEATAYQEGGVYDSLFIFSAAQTLKFIEAHLPDSNTAIFEWFVYNPGSNTYNYLLSDTTDVDQMIITENKGYRVVIHDETSTDTFQCWALIGNASVSIINADTLAEGEDWIKIIPTANKWCHRIRNIKAEIDTLELSYYNPVSGEQLYITGEYSTGPFSWSDVPDIKESGINRFMSIDNFAMNVDVINPYWEDSWYKITVTDQFGISVSDSVFNETIEPHAEFEYEYIYLDDTTYYPDRYDNYYDFYDRSTYDSTSAPALFRFNNLSANAQTLTWSFGDGLTEESSIDSILHTYELPGTYYPKLKVSSMYGHLAEACIDSFPKIVDDSIIIRRPSMTPQNQLPNVFTCPQGKNNVFRFINDVSIADFEIVIYNRFGRKVYHFHGNIRDWEGWDGRDKNSEQYVQTGIYYYVVKELEVLPEYGTGRKVRLAKDYVKEPEDPNQNNQNQDTGDNDGSKSKSNKLSSIYYGFIHVYNNE